ATRPPFGRPAGRTATREHSTILSAATAACQERESHGDAEETGRPGGGLAATLLRRRPGLDARRRTHRHAQGEREGRAPPPVGGIPDLDLEVEGPALGAFEQGGVQHTRERTLRTELEARRQLAAGTHRPDEEALAAGGAQLHLVGNADVRVRET